MLTINLSLPKTKSYAATEQYAIACGHHTVCLIYPDYALRIPISTLSIRNNPIKTFKKVQGIEEEMFCMPTLLKEEKVLIKKLNIFCFNISNKTYDAFRVSKVNTTRTYNTLVTRFHTPKGFNREEYFEHSVLCKEDGLPYHNLEDRKVAENRIKKIAKELKINIECKPSDLLYDIVKKKWVPVDLDII